MILMVLERSKIRLEIVLKCGKLKKKVTGLKKIVTRFGKKDNFSQKQIVISF